MGGRESGWFNKWKQRAKLLKHEIVALSIAYRDSRTPLIAKIGAVCVVAYAVSPIDLIPDFVPVLGYLDDLLLLPIGIWLVLRLIPAEVMADARQQAQDTHMDKQTSWAAAIFIAILWLFGLLLVARLLGFI